MYVNLRKRTFLKKFVFSFFLTVIFLRKKNFQFFKKNTKETEILKNFYFAKRKYHIKTTDLIFTNFFKEKNSMKLILKNIEKRRKLTNFVYRKNIKNLTSFRA